MSGKSTRAYMIVVQLHHPETELGEVKERLESLGIRIDESFDPLPLPSDSGAIMIRGTASESTVADAQDGSDIRFFPDLQVGPG